MLIITHYFMKMVSRKTYIVFDFFIWISENFQLSRGQNMFSILLLAFHQISSRFRNVVLLKFHLFWLRSKSMYLQFIFFKTASGTPTEMWRARGATRLIRTYAGGTAASPSAVGLVARWTRRSSNCLWADMLVFVTRLSWCFLLRKEGKYSSSYEFSVKKFSNFTLKIKF